MSAVQSKIDHYNNLWESVKEEMIRHAGAIARFRGNEMDILAFTEREDYLHSSLYGYKFDLHKSLREVASSIVNGLVKIAAEQWSGSSRLSIDYSKYRELFLENERHDVAFQDSKLAKFHPSHVWSTLEADFGGDKGEEQGFKQAAQNIIEGFRLREGDSMQFKAGCYQLERSMYLDSFDKKWGKNNYSYSCKDSLRPIGVGLEVFMRWAEKASGATHVLQHIHYLCSYHEQVVSREKFICDGELMFITYHNRIEFRLSKALGEKLQMFLGLYGTMLPKTERW